MRVKVSAHANRSGCEPCYGDVPAYDFVSTTIQRHGDTVGCSGHKRPSSLVSPRHLSHTQTNCPLLCHPQISTYGRAHAVVFSSDWIRSSLLWSSAPTFRCLHCMQAHVLAVSPFQLPPRLRRTVHSEKALHVTVSPPACSLTLDRFIKCSPRSRCRCHYLHRAPPSIFVCRMRTLSSSRSHGHRGLFRGHFCRAISPPSFRP